MSGAAGLTPILDVRVGTQTFTQVIPVNRHLNLETASAVTSRNGFDEVYLQTASGGLYAAVGPGGGLNVRQGFTGTVNGEWAQAVRVDDEVNSAGEGAKAPFRAMGDLFKNSGATAVTAMVSTTVGGMMAATAVTSATSATGTRAISHLARTTGSAFTAATQRLAVTGAVGLGIIGTAVGIWSGVSAVRGATRKGDEQTLQMLR